MHPAAVSDARSLFHSIRNIANSEEEIIVVVCPPACFLPVLQRSEQDIHYFLGAQDGHYESIGPYTGQMSIAMLAQFDISYILLGHSDVSDCDRPSEINRKIITALEHNLIPIICIGEEKRDSAGAWKRKLSNSLKKVLAGILPENEIIIAYEPRWAIGARAKRCINLTEFQDAKELIFTHMEKLGLHAPILYGGSVDHVNIHRMVNHADGFLVGRGSLDPRSLHDIIKAIEHPL